jgi:hypothetical protein
MASSNWRLRGTIIKLYAGGQFVVLLGIVQGYKWGLQPAQ